MGSAIPSSSRLFPKSTSDPVSSLQSARKHHREIFRNPDSDKMQQRKHHVVPTKPVLTMIELPVDPSPTPSSAIARFLLGHTPAPGTSNHPRIMAHTHALASAIAATKRKRPISKETHAYLRRELWRNHNKNKRPKRAAETAPLRIMATATAEVQTVETVNTGAQTDAVEISAIEILRIEPQRIEMANAQTQTDAMPKLETTSPKPIEAAAHPIPAPDELASLHEKMCELLHREAKANRELRADFQEMRSMFVQQTAHLQESKARRETESQAMLEALRRDVGAICAEQLTEFCEMQNARENREMRTEITELGETFLREMRAVSEEQRVESREMHGTSAAKFEEQRAESRGMHDALAAKLEKLQLDVDLEHMNLSQEVREESEKTRDVLRADISTVSENQTASFGRVLNIVGALESQLANHSQEAEKTRDSISGDVEKACKEQTAEIHMLFNSLSEMLSRVQAIISKKVHDESALTGKHLFATMRTIDENQTSSFSKLSNSVDEIQNKLISRTEDAGNEATKMREEATNTGNKLHAALAQVGTISVEQTEVIMLLLNNVIATVEKKLEGHCEEARVDAVKTGDTLSGLRTLCEGMRGSFGELLDKQKRQYVRLLEEHGNTREEITMTRKELWKMRDELLADTGAGFRDIGTGLRDLSTVCEGTVVGLDGLKNGLRVESGQIREDVLIAWEALGGSLHDMRVEHKEQHSLVLAGQEKIRAKLVGTRKKWVQRIKALNGDILDLREQHEKALNLLTETGDSLKEGADTLQGSLEHMWEEIMEEQKQTTQSIRDLETGLGTQGVGCREEYLTIHVALNQLIAGQKDLREEFWGVEDRLCIKLSEEGNRHAGEYQRLLDAFKLDMGALDRKIKEMIAVQLGMKTEQMNVKCLLGLIMYRCNYIRGQVEFAGNAQVKAQSRAQEVWDRIDGWLKRHEMNLSWLSYNVVRSEAERAAKEEERNAERKSHSKSLEQKINLLMEKAAKKTQADESSNNNIEYEEFVCSPLL